MRLAGVTAAFLGAGCEPFEGTVAALAYFGLAGEHAGAGAGAAGPGSFAMRFIDALAAIDPATLDAGAHIEEAGLPARGADKTR